MISVTDELLKNIILVKNKNNYEIYEKAFMAGLAANPISYNKKIILASPPLKIPFGIEIYNYKKLINFEFVKMDTNENMHNFYKNIRQLENHFAKMDTIELKNKQFVSCIKPRPGNNGGDDFDPLLRIHLKTRSDKILTTFHDKNNIMLMSLNDIKNKYTNCTIEVGVLWISYYNFGLTFYLNDCRMTD